jgi:hypothetical protein
MVIRFLNNFSLSNGAKTLTNKETKDKTPKNKA